MSAWTSVRFPIFPFPGQTRHFIYCLAYNFHRWWIEPMQSHRLDPGRIYNVIKGYSMMTFFDCEWYVWRGCSVIFAIFEIVIPFIFVFFLIHASSENLYCKLFHCRVNHFNICQICIKIFLICSMFIKDEKDRNEKWWNVKLWQIDSSYISWFNNLNGAILPNAQNIFIFWSSDIIGFMEKLCTTNGPQFTIYRNESPTTNRISVLNDREYYTPATLIHLCFPFSIFYSRILINFGFFFRRWFEAALFWWIIFDL